MNFVERPLVFIHIPKTAGTTFSQILQAAFQGQGRLQVQRLGPEALARVAADTDCPFFAGHVSYRQTQAAFAGVARRPHYVTVLRDPIQRVLSAYSYARENREAKRWHPLASRHDIDEFIAVVAEKHPQFLVGHQCRFVAAEKGADAKAAFQALRGNFGLVGLQKDLEGFMRRLERQMDLHLPRLPPQNRSEKRISLDQLSAGTLRILRETTEKDRQLYDLTLEWLAKEC